MNRQTKKSKTALKQALIRLLAKKSLQDIQIKELCEAADLNRSTFYNNYGTLSDILTEIFLDEIEVLSYQFSPEPLPAPDCYRYTLATVIQSLQYFKDHSARFNLLFSQHTTPTFEEVLYQYYSARFQKHQLDTRTQCILCHQIFGGFALMRHWVQEQYPISTEELASLILELSTPIP